MNCSQLFILIVVVVIVFEKPLLGKSILNNVCNSVDMKLILFTVVL